MSAGDRFLLALVVTWTIVLVAFVLGMVLVVVIGDPKNNPQLIIIPFGFAVASYPLAILSGSRVYRRR